jgi:hypothetical protein
MRKKIKQESGVCPKCGSLNLDYGDTQHEDMTLGYEFVCNDCKCEGIEWYDLKYSESIVDAYQNTEGN